MSTVVLEKRHLGDLEKRLQVQAILAKAGWKPGLESTLVDGQVHEVFTATHSKYPPQRALTLSELVRRCWWQEDNRLVAK